MSKIEIEKMKEILPLKILISAYACGPNWGSEVGMGWNWVVNLSNYCQLTVITEKGFQKDIEKKIPELNLKYPPNFYYIDVGDKGRALFWKQGSFMFYSYYKKWQKKAYHLAVNIISDNNFDIIHQLNMIGFREPGYLWKIKGIPYIIGPVGGYEQFPKSYYSLLNTRDQIFYSLRSIINNLQIRFLKRPKKAYKKANKVLIATPTSLNIISKYTRNKPILISETGCLEKPNYKKNDINNEDVNIVWVGIMQGRKALPLALKSIAKSKYKNKIKFHIIGDGLNLKDYKKLANRLGMKNVVWYGRISNQLSQEVISKSDLLFFTSLLEATSTVIFEAIGANTPVMCHNSHGFGNVIDETCGIKIPLHSPKKSISEFSKKINLIVENPLVLDKLSQACSLRVKQYYWDTKANEVIKIYEKCLD